MVKNFYLASLLFFHIFYVSAEEIQIDLSAGVLVPADFYTRLQFPQCSSNPLLSEIEFEDDYAGTACDMTNVTDHRILKRQSKILRDFQQQIIELNDKKEYEKLLKVSDQALGFVNDSFIFKLRFLRQYDQAILGYFSLRGYRMDFLSGLQYTVLSIVSTSLETSKILQNEELINKGVNYG